MQYLEFAFLLKKVKNVFAAIIFHYHRIYSKPDCYNFLKFHIKFRLPQFLTLLSIFLSTGQSIFGQNISIDTLIIPSNASETNLQANLLRFPIIKTGNLKVDHQINKDLKDRFTNNEYSDLPTDSALIKWVDEQIIYLDFEITYLRNELISLNIMAEGCGAYCSNSISYFTYNYVTGQFLTIDQIIDTSGNFKNLVYADKDRQYDSNKVELKKMYFDKNTAIDKDTYEWAMDEYINCSKEFTMKSFALHTNHLEIIDDCFFPNAIRNFKPNIILRYNYIDIKQDLKIRN